MGSLLFGLLLALGSRTAECLQLTVQPGEVSTVTLSTSLPLDQCSVCELKDQADPACTTSLAIKPNSNVTVQFNCDDPHKSVSAMIESKIDCTKSTCTPKQGSVPASFLSGFNRTFVWSLMAPAETTLVVNVPGDGLKKLAEGEDCEDGYRYTVAASGSDSSLQAFCRNGSVAHLELPNQAKVTLLVSPQEELDPSLFTVMPKPPQKKGRTITVLPEPNTRVIISRKDEGSDCTVCVGEGSSRACGSKQELTEAQTTTVEFSCSNPQSVFTVEVNRDLVCSSNCNLDAIHPEASLFPDFNRTFTWDLKVSSSKAVQLDFPEPGMRQIPSTEHCPDSHTYSIVMYFRGTVGIGTFCRNGTITRVQFPYRGRLTLEVPKDTALTSSDFRFSEATGPGTPVVVATLPRGKSNTDFLSASGIPSEYMTSWNFVVPPLHNATVRFVKYTKPECQSKDVKVTFQQGTNPPLEKTLTDDQTTTYQGNFDMSLTNCDVKKSGPGLFLSYTVSVFRSGIPSVFTVDLQNDPGLSLHIENMNSSSFCELSMDSVVQEKISMPPGSNAKLSFLDCRSDELLLTATRTIDCLSLFPCLRTGNLLTIPSVDSYGLPAPLRQVKWNLLVSEQGSVELTSLQGNLLQSVLGQECDGTVSLLVADNDDSNVGRFCSIVGQGSIQRLQLSSNVTIATKTDGSKDLTQWRGPLLNVSFGPELTDKLIYTITPSVSTPANLATPNWPGGMKPDSTVSWLVTVPEDHSVELLFINISQPECHDSHTEVAVQELGSTTQWAFREDERFDKYDVKSSFYLNMSNCIPQRGSFAILSKISVQKKSRKLLTIILAVVGALLAVMLIILAIVCVAVRKNKRRVNRSSIYIPKGVTSLPGDVTFPKTRVDNDSHVYDSIDDTMIYSHLAAVDGHTDRRPGHFNGHQVGTYNTFTGPMDTSIKLDGSELDGDQAPGNEAYRPFLAPSETFIPSRPRTPLGPVDSMGYEDRRMVDNVLYTFKNPGDPNPIRLSAEEPLRLPEPDSWSGSEEESDPETHYDLAM